MAQYLQTQLERASLSVSTLQRAFASTLDLEGIPPFLLSNTIYRAMTILLQGGGGQSLPNPDDNPAPTQVEVFHRCVADPGTSSHPRALVLCAISPGFERGRTQSPRTEPDCSRAVRGAVALRKVLTNFEFSHVPSLNAAHCWSLPKPQHGWGRLIIF